MSRMFQTLVDGCPTQIGIFLKEDEAGDWICRNIASEGESQ